jgi:hypothetical protein
MNYLTKPCSTRECITMYSDTLNELEAELARVKQLMKEEAEKGQLARQIAADTACAILAQVGQEPWSVLYQLDRFKLTCVFSDKGVACVRCAKRAIQCDWELQGKQKSCLQCISAKSKCVRRKEAEVPEKTE